MERFRKEEAEQLIDPIVPGQDFYLRVLFPPPFELVSQTDWFRTLKERYVTDKGDKDIEYYERQPVIQFTTHDKPYENIGIGEFQIGKKQQEPTRISSYNQLKKAVHLHVWHAIPSKQKVILEDLLKKEFESIGITNPEEIKNYTMVWLEDNDTLMSLEEWRVAIDKIGHYSQQAVATYLKKNASFLSYEEIVALAKEKSNFTEKSIEELEMGDITMPFQSGHFDGVSVGRDKKGYYVTTHRCRSDSYPSPDKIPKSKIDYIETTGSIKSYNQIKILADKPCVLAYVPKEIKKLVEDIQKKIPKEQLTKKDGIPDFPEHITVLFGLDKKAFDEAKEMVEDEKKILCKIKDYGYFDHEGKESVFIIKVDSDDLRKLHTKLKKLPNEETYSTYNPHITIAYMKSGERFEGDLPDIKGKEFKIDNLSFIEDSDKKEDEEIVKLEIRKVRKSYNQLKKKANIESIIEKAKREIGQDVYLSPEEKNWIFANIPINVYKQDKSKAKEVVKDDGKMYLTLNSKGEGEVKRIAKEDITENKIPAQSFVQSGILPLEVAVIVTPEGYSTRPLWKADMLPKE